LESGFEQHSFAMSVKGMVGEAHFFEENMKSNCSRTAKWHNVVVIMLVRLGSVVWCMSH
jgi:hypothetical protein